MPEGDIKAPRLEDNNIQTLDPNIIVVDVPFESPVKRKRGRPRKHTTD